MGRSRTRQVGQSKDAVFLLPGLMGFDQLHDFQYFSDRVAATIRTALWFETGRDIPVIPLATRPTARLARRQAFLVRRLAHLIRNDLSLRGVNRIFLVGHSTGGVDAFLLACERPLVETRARRKHLGFGGVWHREFEAIRRRIRSVIAISSPFFGAAITCTPALRLLGGTVGGVAEALDGVRVLARAGVAISGRLCRGSGLGDLMLNALIDGRASVAMAADVARDHGLIADLEPQAMARLMAQARFTVPGGLHAFASVSPAPEDCVWAGCPRHAGAGALYRLFHQQVRQAGDPGFAPQMAANLANLAQAAPDAIGDRSRLPATWTTTTCDGVVNCGAMLPPATSDVPAGFTVVVGDHADVIGHYDRPRDPLRPEGRAEWANEGLLDSGAGFSDAAFYALYRAVAQRIAAHGEDRP